MKVFIFHHTQDLQDYNEHDVFITKQEAVDLFKKKFLKIIESANIVEVYTNEKYNFYFETRDGQEKLYITEHEI